jgi:hypothetical protein
VYVVISISDIDLNVFIMIVYESYSNIPFFNCIMPSEYMHFLFPFLFSLCLCLETPVYFFFLQPKHQFGCFSLIDAKHAFKKLNVVLVTMQCSFFLFFVDFFSLIINHYSYKSECLLIQMNLKILVPKFQQQKTNGHYMFKG